MSGTSLDGIDLAYCSFDMDSNQYSISHCESIPYSKTWQKKLKNAHTLNAYDLTKLDSDLASHFAIVIKQFIEDKNITDVDTIASHGHTVFHQPQNKFTLQIANPAMFQRNFALGGDSLSRPPRGFSKDQACIDDIKRKSFMAVRDLDPATCLKPQFQRTVESSFRMAESFMRFLCKSVGVRF